MSAILYYGKGNCSIEGKNIRGIQIHFVGNISMTDKTSDNFRIMSKNNIIIIFPITKSGFLNNLFDYEGELKITSVIVSDDIGKKVLTSVNRVMDYSELINTNAEDMGTNSEDLKQTYTSGRKVRETSVNVQNINNLHTSTHDGYLYLENGQEFEGEFHINLNDYGSAMTGKEHSEHSKYLYFSKNRPTKNISSIPYSAINYKKGLKKKRLRTSKSKNKLQIRGTY